MSYYTRLELTWNDSDCTKGTLDVKDIILVAQQCIDDNGWSTDVLKDLEQSTISDGLSNFGFNGLYSFGIIALIQHVSRHIPDVTFFARGVGEEFSDIWLREVRAGVIVKEFGPLENHEIVQKSANKFWWRVWS